MDSKTTTTEQAVKDAFNSTKGASETEKLLGDTLDKPLEGTEAAVEASSQAIDNMVESGETVAENISNTVAETAAQAGDAIVNTAGDAAALLEPAAAPASESTANILNQLGESSIYLMGFSFILGSLFTILVLILLDFMRRKSNK